MDQGIVNPKSKIDYLPYMAIAIANIGPLLGVLWGDWSAFEVVFLYWLENIVIGAFTIMRMVLRPNTGTAVKVGGAFMAAFFCLHYGIFCFAHGSFVMGLIGSDVATVKGANGLIDAATRVLADPALRWAAIGLVVAHMSLYAKEFFADEMGSLKSEMTKPYRRLIVLHVALIFGAFLSSLLGDGALFVMLIMIVGKVVSDIRYVKQDAQERAESTSGNKIVDQIIQHIESDDEGASLEINGNKMTYQSYTEMRDSPQFQQLKKWAGLFMSKKDIERIEEALAEKIAREEGHSGVILDGEAEHVPEDIKVIPRDKDD